MILGGAQENTLLTCEGLHRRGHDVTLITGPALGPEGQLLDRARKGGYQVIELAHLRRAINPLYDLPVYFRLKKLLRSLDADIVHTHSAKAGILGRWAAAAVRAQLRDACCRPLRALQQAQDAAQRRPRIVHTIHGLAFHPYQCPVKNRLYIAVERSAGRVTDAFISVAQAMTQQALAARIGRPEQYTKVFSGLETDAYLNVPSSDEIKKWRGELGIAIDALVVICVARLAELKGHEYIIRAAEQLTPRYDKVVWLFVGDGRWRRRIQRRVAAAHLLERCRFAGLVAPGRVAQLIHASDILVHCSLREGLARVLPQALLCGKAVISFDIDGAREVVRDGETGLLLQPRDVPGLIDAQAKLLQDSQLRRQMGRAGRELCRNEFDSEIMVDRIEKVYSSLRAKAR